MIRCLLALSVSAGALFSSVSTAADEPAPAKLAEPKVLDLPAPASPPVQIKIGQRTGIAEAHSKGLAHHSSPLIDITQPQPNVLIVTMTGLVAAAGLPCEESMDEIVFDLLQSFQVSTTQPNQRVKLLMDAQLAGLMRGNRPGAGTACASPAEAVVMAGDAPILQAGIPGRTHSGKDLVLISVRTPLAESMIVPGEFTLSQRFSISCSHPKKAFHKNVMTAAFGPDTGRAPEWMSLLDPTRDIPKQREFGFRVIVRAEIVR